MKNLALVATVLMLPTNKYNTLLMRVSPSMTMVGTLTMPAKMPTC